MEQEQTTICHWCHTEIVWDEELGPEAVCPHCENELDDYRTISLKGDEEEQEQSNRRATRADLAREFLLEQLTSVQEEAPECPTCRTFMLEAGSQQLSTATGYKAHAPEALGKALLPEPISLLWYVCPSCFTMEQRLPLSAQLELLKRLNPEARG